MVSSGFLSSATVIFILEVCYLEIQLFAESWRISADRLFFDAECGAS